MSDSARSRWWDLIIAVVSSLIAVMLTPLVPTTWAPAWLEAIANFVRGIWSLLVHPYPIPLWLLLLAGAAIIHWLLAHVLVEYLENRERKKRREGLTGLELAQLNLKEFREDWENSLILKLFLPKKEAAPVVQPEPQKKSEPDYHLDYKQDTFEDITWHWSYAGDRVKDLIPLCAKDNCLSELRLYPLSDDGLNYVESQHVGTIVDCPTCKNRFTKTSLDLPDDARLRIEASIRNGKWKNTIPKPTLPPASPIRFTKKRRR